MIQQAKINDKFNYVNLGFICLKYGTRSKKPFDDPMSKSMTSSKYFFVSFKKTTTLEDIKVGKKFEINCDCLQLPVFEICDSENIKMDNCKDFQFQLAPVHTHLYVSSNWLVSFAG